MSSGITRWGIHKLKYPEPKSNFGEEGYSSHANGGQEHNLAMNQNTPLERFESISINFEDYPTNEFVYNFLVGYTQEVDLSKFYAPTAIFSVTVEESTPQSETINVIQQNYSRNILKDTEENYVTDPCKIIEVQKDIFQYGIRWQPSSIFSSEISPGVHSVVLHGYCAVEENITLRFTRSMIIGKEGDLILITNDHVFLSEIKEE